MYIKKIEFTNFRGFQELAIDLPENLAVFIGWNGSGKTTILDGIYKFILAYIYELTLAINNYTHLNLSFQIQESDLFSNKYTGAFRIKIVFDNKNDDIIFDLFFPKDEMKEETVQAKEQFQEFCKILAQQILEDSKTFLPVLAYYQFSSLKIDELEGKNLDNIENSFEIKQMFTYENLLINKFSDYQKFVDWFREQEDKENEIRVRENDQYKNNNLEIIRNALRKFCNNFCNFHFSNLYIVRKNFFKYKQVELKLTKSSCNELMITKDDIDLKISQLSDGEKKCILIVTDIARRLAIANPGLEVSEVLKQGKGIILIDEIEAHLHPGWQREIIPALRKTFPSCQFIVTTHSPQVLSKVKRENVFILENGNIFNAKDSGYHTYGRTSNSILSELMEVPERPFDIKKRLKDCFNLIDEGFKSKDDDKIQKAKDELLKLSNELGEDDLDIVSLNTSFNFRSKIQRNQ